MSGIRILLLMMVSGLAAAKCISADAAGEKIGQIACVTGTVVKVGGSQSGNYFLNFCADYRQCPFTVFVPAKSLRDVGDVRHLQGKTIEISGTIRSYGGHAEIVLKDARQLKGEAAKLPAMPRNFDVERKGKFSAGRYSSPKSSRPKKGRPASATSPAGDAEAQ
jgi:hypothetical protein